MHNHELGRDPVALVRLYDKLKRDAGADLGGFTLSDLAALMHSFGDDRLELTERACQFGFMVGYVFGEVQRQARKENGND